MSVYEYHMSEVMRNGKDRSQPPKSTVSSVLGTRTRRQLDLFICKQRCFWSVVATLTLSKLFESNQI